MSLDVCNILQTACVTCMICLTYMLKYLMKLKFLAVQMFCLDCFGRVGSYDQACLSWKWFSFIAVLLKSCKTLVSFLDTSPIFWHLEFFSTCCCFHFSIFSIHHQHHQHRQQSPASSIFWHQARSYFQFTSPLTPLQDKFSTAHWLETHHDSLIFCDRFYFRPDRVVMTFTLVLKDLHAVYIWRRKSLK